MHDLCLINCVEGVGADHKITYDFAWVSHFYSNVTEGTVIEKYSVIMIVYGYTRARKRSMKNTTGGSWLPHPCVKNISNPLQ